MGLIFEIQLVDVNVVSFNVLLLCYIENDFNDDENEKLIFECLLWEGLVVLYEDFDGDGVKDLLLGDGYGYLM